MLDGAAAVHVLAVGKAAAPMLDAFLATASAPVRSAAAIGPGDAGHPVPDHRSVEAGHRALEMAAACGAGDVFVVLLSGGASALMALPANGLTLDDKQDTVRRLLLAGADITELNTVRKHLSRIKGGRLAAACAGTTLSLAISDVVGDDVSVIGSGPTAADASTWSDALAVLDRRGGRATYARAVGDLLERGVSGALPDTPKPADWRLARSRVHVIGGRGDALSGARHAARALGYHVHVVEQPVVGEARVAAAAYVEAIRRAVDERRQPVCVLSAGETTVRVVGKGKGGRNQEFALAIALEVAHLGPRAAVASVGTDGIDGPTDAAGAIVDSTTGARATAAGLVRDRFLDDNDSFTFFHSLGDLVHLGPTATNVGDIQVALVGK